MKKFLKWFIILIPVFALLIFVVIAALTPNKVEDLPNIVKFTTKDSRVTFSVYETFKSEEKGEYDLYLNKDNKQIMAVFTYNLSDYLESTAKEILDKQVNSFINKRKNMEIFKKELVDDLDDKIITRVEYSGKSDASSDCVYIFATIQFKNDPNYVIYVHQVILKNEYEKANGEMINILESAKLN